MREGRERGDWVQSRGGGGNWVTMGRLSCSGLLDMGREKKGRSVTWVAKGGRGRKRERGQIGGGVELCLIGGERHSLNGSGVDLEFK